MKAILILVALLVMPASTLSMSVVPHVVWKDGLVRIVCSVPRASENREIEAGIAEYTSSIRQLDGADAPITHRFEFKDVPCDVDTAYCLVRTWLGDERVTTQGILVAGCDQ